MPQLLDLALHLIAGDTAGTQPVGEDGDALGTLDALGMIVRGGSGLAGLVADLVVVVKQPGYRTHTNGCAVT